METLFHSEAGFAAALTARAQRLGLPGNVTVASSRQVAHIAARRLSGSGETHLLPPGTEAAFLATLPIDILDPEDALAETLTRFGVHRVSDLLALPRRALHTRLGPEVLQLIELARGQETDTPLPVPKSARLLEDGQVRWIEVCYCREAFGPGGELLEELPYWQEFFEDIDIRYTTTLEKCEGYPSCGDCECTDKLEPKLERMGRRFYAALKKKAASAA